MLMSLIFTLAVLALVLKAGYALGELSPAAGLAITTSWLTVAVLTVTLNWPPELMIVAAVALAIIAILAVFGGDLRIR